MKYYVFIILFLAQIANTFGQDRINLVSSDVGKTINDKNVFIRGLYEHNGNTLYADSSYIYQDEIGRDFFEGFGNVVITQPSGTTIYSNRLHYDATSQQAILTGNVRMVDQNSTLTTNYLTYNMRSKRGTYTGGGRIISRGDTITSKNAYYFENTGDAYFRNKVVVRSPNVKVFTDSMQYNSLSRMTYFFGPTNIKGNKNENLYTEKGTYNLGSGIAKFSRNNLYTEGSKFLKGDSLYYNRTAGIGEAFGNVVFVDTLDKFYAFGGKGVYTQLDESILMTDKPYIITIIKNDSTETDSPVENQTIRQIDKKSDKTNKVTAEKKTKEKSKDVLVNSAESPIALPPKENVKIDSVYMTADTLFSRMIPAKDYKPLNLNLDRNGGKLLTDQEENFGDENDDLENQDSTSISKDEKIKDIKPALNTVQTNVEKKVVEKTKTPSAPKNNKDPLLNIDHTLKADSVLRQKAVIPADNHANTVINSALKVAQSTDSVKNNKIDSISPLATDTAKTRIVKAYHNVRLYKSDLQAVADSVYYGMQDSMFRFMGKPMIWAEGSQISSDTIFMQIKNQRMDNALLKNNAFMVNAVLDTVKFNQLKGRQITAFFKNNNIEKIFVDGNAENLIFVVNEDKKIITELFHDRSARIKVLMEDKKLVDYVSYLRVDQKIYPFKMVTQENEILPGFIWRPQDRPTSKEDLLNRKREISNDNTEQTNLSESNKTNTDQPQKENTP